MDSSCFIQIYSFNLLLKNTLAGICPKQNYPEQTQEEKIFEKIMLPFSSSMRINFGKKMKLSQTEAATRGAL